ncbi:MAG: protoporphyrinogen oxidase HemJ [Gammaproteobacteria bacterium]|jgi:protoporphyrinogen IX oxidase|nr:protoporphyrinogen oxidase HemJ [Gammaproteobacteria bacterium]MBT5826538.1 protoporphyrinogen oxidase HemJ [Gammaproteobacteria bacterium]MBT5967125.1 protoporphyrinogen oxidase HemJ [Gammaproteobacteria bacterium]MBT6577055.1 protoporphyrinogen oxidase HemJ [Gammaproteobacteria bacterium]MBT7435895.1 protoporphyrinogen oxidase HemJ [Gammaproteobacteria bacterium]
MLWLKAFHLIFMVTWFAGLFYLPRLYIYHAMSEDEISNERFKIMERKLFYGIMTPGMVITFVFGIWMLVDYAWGMYAAMGWLHVKLTLLTLLLVYHYFCYRYLVDFKLDRNRHSHVFYRWFNEIPVLFLLVIVILAVVKPF